MTAIATPIRIESAFPDREAVRALFYQVSQFQAVAAYLPDGSDDRLGPRPVNAVLPWFRGTWALGGECRLAGVEAVLHNRRFIDAAQQMFPGARIIPKTVVVNVNAPMPAGVPHVDVPSFRGATREHLPLRLLIAMGASGLFEQWRVVEAGAISWFYDGPGGDFDYWPDGPAQQKRSECAPFGNVAIIADNDRMWHRIGRIGPPDATLPEMTAAAEIRPTSDGSWSIFERDQLRVRYPQNTIRLSVLWKAEAMIDRGPFREDLSPDEVIGIFRNDLARRGVFAPLSLDPLNDPAWITMVHQTYTRLARSAAPCAND